MYASSDIAGRDNNASKYSKATVSYLNTPQPVFPPVLAVLATSGMESSAKASYLKWARFASEVTAQSTVLKWTTLTTPTLIAPFATAILISTGTAQL